MLSVKKNFVINVYGVAKKINTRRPTIKINYVYFPFKGSDSYKYVQESFEW